MTNKTLDIRPNLIEFAKFQIQYKQRQVRAASSKFKVALEQVEQTLRHLARFLHDMDIQHDALLHWAFLFRKIYISLDLLKFYFI